MRAHTDGNFIFTSESVTEGHPDKICDQISDAILDAMIAKDPHSRVAVETAVTTGLVVVMGEVTTKTYVDIQSVVRQTIKDIGYDDQSYGFHWQDCGVLVSIHEQSPDIAQGVDTGRGTFKAQGAGDQGLMFGYATRQTPELMPLPITLAHKLARRLALVRKKKVLSYLRPDGKTEVALEYVNYKPKRLETVVIAAQHDEHVSEERVERDIIRHVIRPVCRRFLDRKTKFYINATGKFIIGGPPGDTGVTGRKIIVDSYGGSGAHGGGAFSGKDPSKVDRSGAYMARYIAKNLVAAGFAYSCEVQLAYVIGVAEPISIRITRREPALVDDRTLLKLVRQHFDLTPGGIIKHLRLLRPIYKKTAAYGHFGRSEPTFTWERIDKAAALRRYAFRLSRKATR